MNKNTMIIGAVVLTAIGGAYFFGMMGQSGTGMMSSTGSSGMNMAVNSKPTVNVKVPELGQVAKLGEEDFNNNCAACHGKNAAGTGNGPPLVHRFYNPNHHADYAFKRAVEQGVRAHHWKYGNMPPQKQVKDYELARIVTYVRELQKANGIF